MDTATAAKFDRILDLEAERNIARAVRECQLAGVPLRRRDEQQAAHEAAQAKLTAALDALTVAELVAFNDYRRNALAL